MTISAEAILDVLSAYNIFPQVDDDVELPGVGQMEEGESVYSTSLPKVLGSGDGPMIASDVGASDEPRIREWRRQLEGIISDGRAVTNGGRGRPRAENPEPHCAWYCPIHFYGHGWGIYIRESCVLSLALDIATFVDWRAVRIGHWDIPNHLLRSAFYVFFLHEQFHHKVESLGFRLLVSTGTDRYRPYKNNVYRKTFLTTHCIEESLSNAESIRRLTEKRYVDRVDEAIRSGLRKFLKASFKLQPPGYREALNYLSEASYRQGLYNLQSQILDGACPPTTAIDHWSIAPNMITSLADISDDIYVVLPRGARPIFTPTSVDPSATTSSRALESALNKHYGYSTVRGGKGSHLKLKKAGAPTIIIPGNRPVVSPGVVKQALQAVGGYPISRLPELLEGRL